jgi:hypothetical protein
VRAYPFKLGTPIHIQGCNQSFTLQDSLYPRGTRPADTVKADQLDYQRYFSAYSTSSSIGPHQGTMRLSLPAFSHVAAPVHHDQYLLALASRHRSDPRLPSLATVVAFSPTASLWTQELPGERPSGLASSLSWEPVLAVMLGIPSSFCEPLPMQQFPQ